MKLKVPIKNGVSENIDFGGFGFVAVPCDCVAPSM